MTELYFHNILLSQHCFGADLLPVCVLLLHLCRTNRVWSAYHFSLIAVDLFKLEELFCSSLLVANLSLPAGFLSIGGWLNERCVCGDHLIIFNFVLEVTFFTYIYSYCWWNSIKNFISFFYNQSAPHWWILSRPCGSSFQLFSSFPMFFFFHFDPPPASYKTIQTLFFTDMFLLSHCMESLWGEPRQAVMLWWFSRVGVVMYTLQFSTGRLWLALFKMAAWGHVRLLCCLLAALTAVLGGTSGGPP